MTKPELKCPTCHEAMQQGFFADFSLYPRNHRVATWVKGPLQKSWFWGLDVEGEGQHEIVAFRCPRCGLLQSYAL
jgi:hypothetical protein